MTLTLLLDLDDTCLGNSMDTFIPAYLQALGDHLSAYLPAEKLVSSLLASTQLMLQNKRPDQRLKQVFDQNFYPSIGIDSEDLRDELDSFYLEKFPRLRELTQFRPEAVRLVEEAFERGYSVVIATNPLFPRTAILQRLEWAGLSPQKYPFSLIPSYESSFFAKPNTSFFAEILSRLGWSEGPVIMVGDDIKNDISPANKMGLATFWITNGRQPPSQKQNLPSGQGTLADLLDWLDSTPSENLIPDFNHQEGMLAILRATPAVLHAFSCDLESDNWLEHPEPGEWSFTEIFCHLRDVDAEVNLPRIEKVLNETNPFIPGIDTDQWAEERIYYCQNGQEALSDFTSSRIQLLNILDALKPDDWNRSARHTIFGPTDMEELVRIIMGHDRLHVRQAYRSLGETLEQAVSNSGSTEKIP
jgi:FMN phosphatase YigB (HAD superfamily)